MELFTLTEKMDDLVTTYLINHRDCIAVHISSGGVYGSDFAEPANKDKMLSVSVNNIKKSNYYSIVKLNAEAKHRAAANLKIVDIRLFSYFSKYIDLSNNYFMTDIVRSIQSGTQLITNRDNFVRDYIHPGDLAQLIYLSICQKKNLTVDAYSAHPISKYEILEYVQSNFGLTFRYDDVSSSATGEKSQYYSIYKEAKEIEYNPRFTSSDSIKDGLSGLLGQSFT